MEQSRRIVNKITYFQTYIKENKGGDVIRSRKRGTKERGKRQEVGGMQSEEGKGRRRWRGGVYERM